ncbi:twin-arginine translocation signal domain-containing protein [Candidatus Pacearchaeota archaeon]|nr:twin-arginine translocation signal domain-containing protein [Candidatus Pacearchaeota archaeon]
MQTRRQFMRASALTGLALLLNSDLYGQNQSNVSERDFRYAIVTSKDTYRGEWAKPSDTLKAKYQNRDHIFQFEDDISEIRDALREYAPTHVALVAKPKELAIPYIPRISSFESLEEQRKIAESSLVGKFNVLLSQLDEDEYRDSIGGIITGYSAKDVFQIV